MGTSRRPVLATATLAGSLALSLALSGCAASQPGEQSQQGAGYTSTDGRIATIPVDKRGESVAFSGTSERGEPVSSEDYAGKVYVVNFWYAACGPCIAEAPFLKAVWEQNRDAGVGFVGVNIYDQPATAVAFAEDHGITYPSVIDVNDGRVKQAFAGVTPIQATPTTLIMDRKGRVAARIIGQIESASVLAGLLNGVLEESQ